MLTQVKWLERKEEDEWRIMDWLTLGQSRHIASYLISTNAIPSRLSRLATNTMLRGKARSVLESVTLKERHIHAVEAHARQFFRRSPSISNLNLRTT